jgi:hypothetical protein
MINVITWYCIWHLSTDTIILPKFHHEFTGFSTGSSGIMGDTAPSYILHKSKLSIHTTNYMCIHKGVNLKFELQHSATWLAAAWLLHCSVIRQQHPSTTFVSLCFHFRKEVFGACVRDIWCMCQRDILFQIFFLFKNCVSLKLRKSVSVCVLFSGMPSVQEHITIPTCRMACPVSSGC